MEETTTIRITKQAHKKLRFMAYEENKSITEIIDEFVGVKRVEPELTTVDKLMRKNKLTI